MDIPIVYYILFFVVVGILTAVLKINIFKLLADLVNGVENSLLNLLGAIVPYAVPVIPAYLTYHHTYTIMQFPDWVAGTAAFVVEVLGLTSVTTAINFYRHNQKYKDEKNKAPFVLALGIYVFYIFVVIFVNVILEKVAGTRSNTVIIAIAIFSTLSIPSGVLIAIRNQYRKILEDIDTRYHSTKPQGGQPPAKPQGAYTQKPASHYHDKIIDLLEKEYRKTGRVLAPKDITSKLGINHNNGKGYVSDQTGKWCDSKGIPRPVRSKNVPERSTPEN